MEYQGYYRSPPQQDYFQQQNYPHFTESDDLEEPDLEVAATTTYRPPRSSDTSTIRTSEDHHTTSVEA